MSDDSFFHIFHFELFKQKKMNLSVKRTGFEQKKPKDYSDNKYIFVENL